MSEQYLVSARKYRPLTFDTVIGQEHITTTLKNAIKTSHLAHAYLFCGPRGVGKTTCARILAKTINCEAPTADLEACGKCTTCVATNDNASFNVFELDAASNNSVDDIRALTEQVRYAPQVGKYKIYIIDEVHMLSSAAFNAFLKTLEEPPSYAIFILATTEKHKILPTILSRCQIFDFKRIMTEDIVRHLNDISQKEHTQVENAALHIIAQKSEGCMRDALSMLDRISSFSEGIVTYDKAVEHLNILDATTYFKLTDYLLSKNASDTLLILDEIIQKGFEGDIIMNGMAQHFRDLLLCKDPRMAKMLDIPEEHKRVYYDKATITPSSFILSALNILNEAELNYRNALNKRLHTELCFLKLTYLNDVLSTEDSIVKKKLSSVQNEIQSSVQVEQKTPPPVSNSYKPTTEQVATNPLEQSLIPPVSIQEPQSNEFSALNEPSTVSIPPIIGTKKPKLGRNMLQQVIQQNDQSLMDKEITILSQTVAEQLAKDYIQQIKEKDQMAVATQLSQLLIKAVLPDEINLICVSSINYHFANNHRDRMLDFCKAQTGNNNIRMTLTLDESLRKEPEYKVISKSDVFQNMVLKNPAILDLKNKLNLNLEM